jgi:hypothetical protein
VSGTDEPDLVQEPRRWRDKGWTAQVIKNEDDEGWAVAMYLDGQAEPALVGPWTMGRDKKNPKPLDGSAFNTLVKTATEVINRHAQQLHAQLHKSLYVAHEGAWLKVSLDIVPSEDEPYALLSADDAAGSRLAQVRVPAHHKLTKAGAEAWVASGFERPR